MGAMVAGYDEIAGLEVPQHGADRVRSPRVVFVGSTRLGSGGDQPYGGDLLPALDARLEAWAAQYRQLTHW